MATLHGIWDKAEGVRRLISQTVSQLQPDHGTVLAGLSQPGISASMSASGQPQFAAETCT